MSAIVVSGCVWLGLTLAKTIKDVKQVKSWVEVPCLITVVRAGLDPMSDAFIQSHSWFIFYKYEYDGRQFTSSRYNIVEKGKKMDSDDQKVMDRTPFGTKPKVREPYSVGDKTVCFVNPENPSDAVLVHEVRNWAILKRLALPGILVVGPLLAILYTLWEYWYLSR
ncbi:MAG: DUF3592 domain-containing protein [Sedimentisphaerales bacterium]|nr:DUF3592 domain-containing protein [Sedimentisphaerales bacterium]